MGTYSKRISKRQQYAKLHGSKGYCVICSQHKELTKDHVPPKGAINITAVEQKTFTEELTDKDTPVKSIKASHGSYFKTICKDCNSFIGSNFDQEIANVYKNISEIVKNYFLLKHDNHFISTKVDAARFMRGMIAHILSATSTDECAKQSKETSYFTPLKKFVLGQIQDIQETHKAYYWFYPYEQHISAKYLIRNINNEFVSMSVLSFIPMGFMLIDKKSTYMPDFVNEIKAQDHKIDIDISKHPHHYWPLGIENENEFMAINDSQVTITYPLKHSK